MLFVTKALFSLTSQPMLAQRVNLFVWFGLIDNKKNRILQIQQLIQIIQTPQAIFTTKFV
jgi:hypothetical protein